MAIVGATSVKIDGVSYPIQDLSAVSVDEAQTLTDAQQAQGRENIEAASETYSLLQAEEIPNTTQAITFDSTTGDVSTITHTNGSTVIRTDAFTFGDGTITEVRTLNTGKSLTISTNTTTLETVVTYTAA